MRVVLLFCLSTLPPVCCLSEIYDECSRLAVLAAVSTPILLHPSASPFFSFHSPTPLLLSHTSLLSNVQPTSRLLLWLSHLSLPVSFFPLFLNSFYPFLTQHVTA